MANIHDGVVRLHANGAVEANRFGVFVIANDRREVAQVTAAGSRVDCVILGNAQDGDLVNVAIPVQQVEVASGADIDTPFLDAMTDSAGRLVSHAGGGEFVLGQPQTAAQTGKVVPFLFQAPKAMPVAPKVKEVVVVDHRGGGQFTTIKEAADHIINTTTFGVDRSASQRWIIFVMPGHYVEDAFELTGYVTLTAFAPYGPSFGGLDTKPVIIENSTNVTSGAFITVRGGEIVGPSISLTGTPTGPLTAISTDIFWVNLDRVTVQQLASATTHEVSCIEVSGNSNARLNQVFLLHETGGQTNAFSLRTKDDGAAFIFNSWFSDVTNAPAAAIQHESTGTVTLRGLFIGQSSGSSYVTDFVNAGAGTIRVEAASYSTSSGVISGPAPVLAHSNVPASASSAGTPGMIAWDATHAYFCVAQDTWRRVAIASW